MGAVDPLDPETHVADSAIVWLPPLVRARLHVPKTEFVPFEREAFWAMLGACDVGHALTSDQEALIRTALQSVKHATTKVGFPAFIRSDMASAKHDGPGAYRIDDAGVVMRRMVATAEDNALKEIMPSAFLVRQWLDLEAPFSAFRGHRVAREWRLFATSDRVVCSHFYWPEDAIWFSSTDTPAGWTSSLRAMAKEPPPTDVEEAAIKAARLNPRATCWSVDFARDVSERWWLIDMAVAGHSWHPPTCPSIKRHKGLLADDRTMGP